MPNQQVIALLRQAIALLEGPMQETPQNGTLLWGAKVSDTFKERVRWIGTELGINPDYLMACMAFETGEAFSPSVKNMAGSGATGLIQFMPATARGLGTTTEAMAQMTAEDQLRYVYHYFAPYKDRLNTLEDVYMAILWPRAVGQPNSYILFSGARSTAYRQNAGLDKNRDEKITKAEAAGMVLAKAAKGESFRG